MNKPNCGNSFVLHGVRFYWNYDSLQYEAQVTPDHIGEVFEMGALSADDPFWNDENEFEKEINHIRDNPGNNRYSRFYDHEIAEKVTQTAKNIVRNHYGETYDEAPVCPYCGTKRGFAFGTGDCGCEVDPE